MALSNWDTLALDRDGHPTDGAFPVGGVTVKVYKNWLYVQDPEGWTEGGSYVEPTVMQVNEGHLVYKGVRIHAARGPQDGIFVIAHEGSWFSAGARVMAACGVYGWGGKEESEWLGVTQESVDFLQRHFFDWRDQNVSNDDMAALYDAFPTALRFNQGDAFFADRVGADVPASEIGRASKPFLTQFLDEMDSPTQARPADPEA